MCRVWEAAGIANHLPVVGTLNCLLNLLGAAAWGAGGHWGASFPFEWYWLDGIRPFGLRRLARSGVERVCACAAARHWPFTWLGNTLAGPQLACAPRSSGKGHKGPSLRFSLFVAWPRGRGSGGSQRTKVRGLDAVQPRVVVRCWGGGTARACCRQRARPSAVVA